MLHIFSLFRNIKFWLSVQGIALVWGNFVGWSAIIHDVDFFCRNEGKGLEALLSFTGTFTTNPLLAPCFWGSIVFAIALVWTVRLLLMKSYDRLRTEFKRLFILLIVGVLFAFVNNIPVFYRFYTTPVGEAIGCSPDKFMVSPFETSCFLGFSAFTLATVAAIGVRRQLPNKRI